MDITSVQRWTEPVLRCIGKTIILVYAEEILNMQMTENVRCGNMHMKMGYPIDMFMEEVEDGREDNITNQKYRFELYDGK